MVCPLCGGRTKVINSRRVSRTGGVWRRRQCEACGEVFSTKEMVAFEGFLKVQRATGQLEPFQPEKLFLDIEKCLRHQPRHISHAKELASTAIAKLLAQRKGAIIPVSEVGVAVASVLKNYDKTAWLSYLAQHPSVPRPKRFTWR